MPHGGELTIETANFTVNRYFARPHVELEPGRYVSLAVSDNGSGITDEVKAHLFEPFFTTKPMGEGTGLGLATCFGIVKQSGGQISVSSEPGQGTTFEIYLQRVEETPKPILGLDQTGNMPLGDETILLVEDEFEVRDLTARTLRDLGYTVLEASNGSEALRVAQAHPESERQIHMLLTDMVMPQMGGVELSGRLKSIRSNLRVLFMSGYTTKATIRPEFLDLGDALLPKPYTAELLARKVREVLDKAK